MSTGFPHPLWILWSAHKREPHRHLNFSMGILNRGQPAPTLSLTTKYSTGTKVAVGWAQLHSPHASPIHPLRLFQHRWQHSSVPEASYHLAHDLFLLEPGTTLLLSVGTGLNCYLQSNERKTWTLRRAFPSKEDNTSIPFIRG